MGHQSQAEDLEEEAGPLADRRLLVLQVGCDKFTTESTYNETIMSEYMNLLNLPFWPLI